MTQRSTESCAGSRCAPLRFWVLGLYAVAWIFTGCAAQQKTKAKTFPWASVRSVRPVLPKLTVPSDVPSDNTLAELELDVPPPPSPLAVTPSVPQRPRIPTAASAPSTPSRPEPPQIAPQLTAEETAAAQQQTNLSLSIAERNIAALQGRALNASQSDLASKVRSFVTEARDAAHVGDWTRASSAAKKAQVLSEELARSL
jgi:type IV secretory pathway VirB10-like protein